MDNTANVGFGASDQAMNNLRAAETKAGGVSLDRAEDSIAGVRSNEAMAGGLYTGIGKTIDKGGSKISGILKNKGPIAAIIGIIVGVGLVAGGMQLFQPFSLIEQFRESFNSMQTAASLRSATFFTLQMDSGRTKNPIKGTLFGGETFRLSSSQRAQLSAQGIEYDEDFENTGIRVLKFDDGTGEIRIVAVDDKAVKALNEMNLKGFDSDYNAEAVSFKNLYANNSDFYNGYNKGSLTWRGAIANWFNSLTIKFLDSNKITRNLFQDFRKKVAESESGNTRTVALEMMAKGTEEIKDGGIKTTTSQEEEVGEDGKIKTKDVEMKNLTPEEYAAKVKSDGISGSIDDPAKSSTIERASVGSTSGTTKLLNDIGGKVQKGANVICTVANFLGTVNLVVTASESLQIINLVTSYFEAVDKTKAGYGGDSPINELANALNETKEASNQTLETAMVWDANESSNFEEGSDGNVVMKTLKTVEYPSSKTAMQSSGIAALYGGGAVNPNDPNVQSFNFSGNISRVFKGLGTSMQSFETCAVVKVAANLTTAFTDALAVIGCIGGLVGTAATAGVAAPAGVAACQPLVAGTIRNIAFGVAIGVTIGGLISAITPVVADMFKRDLIMDIGGEALGNALTSGANMYLGNAHRSNGGSLANREEYTQFALAQQQVIAENAKYERSQKSPFDITSKYTFMGNLMTKMMSLMSINSVMSAVIAAGATMSSSVIALSPTASAYDIAGNLLDEETYSETCPYIASIGAVGDAYCNPYSITDVSTINEDPVDVINILDSQNNFLDETTSDGNVIIKADSDLAKYILYCNNRNSAFGIVDQNIANAVGNWGVVNSSSAFVNNASNSAIGAVPVIGDFIDVVQNSALLANIGYIGGQSCVAGNNVQADSPTAVESPSWSTAKYYQRFIEDQSLAETMGLIGENGKSAVTAFLDEYYEEHPLDNSYEGILARYSGLEKDTVVALLDIIEYYDYVAQYDPTTRYIFKESVVEKSQELIFSDENVVADDVYIILLDNVVFADVRNRNFVV